MYYMGFSINQISICLKGILWTDLFIPSNPGQFDTQIYFPRLVVSVAFIIIFHFSFCLCVIYFIYTTGLCKVRKSHLFQRVHLIPLVTFVS